MQTGLIATRGFRDTLEMRREFKYDLYDLFIEMPRPLVRARGAPRSRERIRADGSVDTPLDEASVLEARPATSSPRASSRSRSCSCMPMRTRPTSAARATCSQPSSRACTCRSRARCRRRSASTNAPRRRWPMPTCAASPIATSSSLEARLQELGIGCPLLMMLSNGGLTHVGEARTLPGAAARVGPGRRRDRGGLFQQALRHRRRAGLRHGRHDREARDRGREPAAAGRTASRRAARSASPSGSGLPINISTVELIEIGAGGGSIAHLDSLGLLKVGPQSAGSAPGPACYGRGGTEPTVTDAQSAPRTSRPCERSPAAR